ncbi:MAG: hypothetical protein EOM32_15110 [Spirochaetia bacterium]|nr:hypothetical protein [Spirochaetia bacterium]
MKGKIDSKGKLLIERADGMKMQDCPFSPESSCGDWCPLFGEPVFDEDRVMQVGRSGDAAGSVKVGLKESASLSLCHRNLRFEKLTDERNLEVCLETFHD